MTRTWFELAWYGDAIEADHAVLYPDARIATSRGDLALPPGGNVLYLRVSELNGHFCIAGQGHKDGLAWLWNIFWSPCGPTYGTSPVCFGPLGLYISTPATVDNIRIYDVETLKLRGTITKAVGSRGIAAITGLGTEPADVHSVDEWYGAGGLAEYTDLGDGLLVGQGAHGGLCARDGEAFVELEPGSVQFVRASLDGGLITTAAWKDQEKGAVIVRLNREELHPMARSTRFWLHPNIASADLLQLIDRPDLLANVGVFGLYVQEIIYDDAPNTSAALITADVYRKLAAAGVPLNIEMGSVKGGDCQCANALGNLERAVGTVRDHGGEVAYVSQDEPLTAWIDYCKGPIEPIADSVATFMKRATELGVPNVGWIEAWPHVGFATQQQFLDLLAARAVVPAHWHLDIDHASAQREGKNVAAFIHAAEALAQQRGITLGLLVNSTADPIATDVAHWANLDTLAHTIQSISPNAPRIVVQSWARRIKDGPQTVPNNLGDKGLASSLLNTMTVFGAAPPMPSEPPPIEGPFMTAYGAPMLGFNSGNLEPHPDGDGAVAVRKPNGYILCVTPDGNVEQRPNDGSTPTAYTPGPWEKFRKAKNGASLIAERDGGRVYVLALVE